MVLEFFYHNKLLDGALSLIRGWKITPYGRRIFHVDRCIFFLFLSFYVSIFEKITKLIHDKCEIIDDILEV